jgi:hypothetical protein
MVTTRRSSFGIQDGDTLALRSKLTPASTDTTPSRKRKEYAVGMRSSSRKKRKSYGIDGEDDVVVAQMQGAGPASNKDGSSFAEPAPDSAHREEMGLGLGILSGKKSELEEPKSWLEDDSVSPSSKAPAPRSNVEQKHDIPEKGEPAISPEDHPIDGHGQKAEDLAMMNYRKGKKLTDHESRDEPRNTIEIVDQKPPVQRSTANMHKRFGSEEPVLIDNEGASTGLQEDEREAGSANGDEEDDTSSDDDAPEIVGSKSVSKDIRLPVKAPRKAKRKAKPSKAINEQATTTEDERAHPENDTLFDDPPPGQVSTNTLDLSLSASDPLSIRTKLVSGHHPSKKRKLFDESEKKPKDIIKGGVTYRTVSDPQPTALASKRHRTSHLPPKSNTNGWRLRKQVLGRKRVQHVWGGRSAFLRT